MLYDLPPVQAPAAIVAEVEPVKPLPVPCPPSRPDLCPGKDDEVSHRGSGRDDQLVS